MMLRSSCNAGFDCYLMTGSTAVLDCPNYLACGNPDEFLCDLAEIWEKILCQNICPDCKEPGVCSTETLQGYWHYVRNADINHDYKIHCYCLNCHWVGSIKSFHVDLLIANWHLDLRLPPETLTT